jgi:hypothetical protein
LIVQYPHPISKNLSFYKKSFQLDNSHIYDKLNIKIINSAYYSKGHIMTTKQMLLSALICGATGNNTLTTETHEKNTTHFQYENGSVFCTINEDHIVYDSKYKRDHNDSCIYSGPLLLSEINDALKNQSELPISQNEYFSADIMGKVISSGCDCYAFIVMMRNKNNPEKIQELFNQAIKTQQ